MPSSPTTVFADAPGPRRETGNRLHLRTDIRTIATCGPEQIAEHGVARKER